MIFEAGGGNMKKIKLINNTGNIIEATEKAFQVIYVKRGFKLYENEKDKKSAKKSIQSKSTSSKRKVKQDDSKSDGSK